MGCGAEQHRVVFICAPGLALGFGGAVFLVVKPEAAKMMGPKGLSVRSVCSVLKGFMGCMLAWPAYNLIFANQTGHGGSQ